jgi:hypothetical protein
VMRNLSVLATFLAAALLVGCSGADNTAAQKTPPEDATVGSTTVSTQPENTMVTAVVPEKAATAKDEPAGWVSALGDSVMLGAVEALQQEIPNLGLLNAQGSRQPSAAIGILRQWQTAGYLGDAVVIDIGNNGPFSSEQFDEMMQVLDEVPKVLIVTLTVPPGVEDPIAVSNNTILTDRVERYPNTVLVDWQAASIDHPEYFSANNTHLSLQGAEAYSHLIAAHLGPPQEGSETPPGPQQITSWGEGGFFGKCVGPPSWCAATTTP